MGKAYPRILAELAATHWAITPEALEGILAAVHGEITPDDYALFHGASAEDHAAMSSTLGDLVPDARYARVSGSVGSISINGPIVPRASAIAESSGIMSIDRLTSEFEMLEQDSSVDKILLIFDSPGGAVTGISEFASLISASKKETIAYVYGHAASAAYWLASAADSIVSSETGLVGSIGTIVTVDTKQDDNRAVIRNSQSPRKQPDPTTDKGRADIVAVLDQLADVFMSDVAAGRGVDKQRVIENFGQGALFGAAKAQAAGMIDRVLPLRSLTNMLQGNASDTSGQVTMSASPLDVEPWLISNTDDHGSNASDDFNPRKETNEMTFEELKAQYAEQIKALEETARAEGMRAETERFGSILAAVQPVLSGDAYPESIRAMALKVLAGEENKDVLRGAIVAIDAMRATKEADAAVADTDALTPTPAGAPNPQPLSEDGVLRSTADADADVEFLKEYV